MKFIKLGLVLGLLGLGACVPVTPSVPGPRVVKEPFPVMVNSGEPGKFSVTVEASSGLSYQWMRDGVDIPGAQAASYQTPALFEQDSGAEYSVRAWCQEGTVQSLGAPVQVKVSGTEEFPIGVWMQAPTKTWDGRSRAAVYRDLGINHFMGLWGWPVEDYAGSNVAAMNALKAVGMKVYAGPTQDLETYNKGDIRGLMDQTLAWLKDHPGYEGIYKGFLMGDEADMASANYRNTPETQKYAWSIPETFNSNSLYFRNAYAGGNYTYSGMKFFANFGKPFSKGMYYFKGPSTVVRTLDEMIADFRLMVDPLDAYASDYYGITDPYETRGNHGVWTYGRSVTTAHRWALGSDGKTRENWGFLEASAPWRSTNFTQTGNYLTKRQQPQYLAPIVWNMIIHGATGYIYFCHDFLTPQSGISDAGALYEPGIPQAMAGVNAQVQAYSSFLLSKDSTPGVSVTVSGPVPVSFLVKSYQGTVLIFAQGDGNTSYPDGAEVTGTFEVTGGPWTKAVALKESRTIPVAGGKFTDSFGPYQVHIYRLE